MSLPLNRVQVNKHLKSLEFTKTELRKLLLTGFFLHLKVFIILATLTKPFPKLYCLMPRKEQLPAGT
jgi:hypothetical protein